MTKLVMKGMHSGRRSKQLMIVSSSKSNPRPSPNRKSPIALAHAAGPCVHLDDCLCSYLLCCGLHRFMVHGYVSRLWPGLFHVFALTCASPIATVLFDSCACGRVYWSSSSRSSSWYSASPPRDFHQVPSDLPVAGIRLLGLLRRGLVLFCFLFCTLLMS